jgi:hypothetical protein
MSDDNDLDAFMWSQRHMTVFALCCLGVGIGVGVTVLEPEWPLAKRALGGAFLGVGTAVILLANRLLRDDDD